MITRPNDRYKINGGVGDINNHEKGKLLFQLNAGSPRWSFQFYNVIAILQRRFNVLLAIAISQLTGTAF